MIAQSEEPTQPVVTPTPSTVREALQQIANGFAPKGDPGMQYYYAMTQAEARNIALAALSLLEGVSGQRTTIGTEKSGGSESNALHDALLLALDVLPSARIASNPYNVAEITAHNRNVDVALNAVRSALSLPASAGTKSGVPNVSSLPSVESDPSVTLACGTPDTALREALEKQIVRLINSARRLRESARKDAPSSLIEGEVKIITSIADTLRAVLSTKPPEPADRGQRAGDDRVFFTSAAARYEIAASPEPAETEREAGILVRKWDAETSKLIASGYEEHNNDEALRDREIISVALHMLATPPVQRLPSREALTQLIADVVMQAIQRNTLRPAEIDACVDAILSRSPAQNDRRASK